jgi:crotonobetainyl-CoA:carnitine CoA-transferase CaiB-like acyl-CoA transferase
VPHGPVNNMEQALNQPIVRERGFVKEVQHPVAGTVKMVGSPLRFEGKYEDSRLEPPPLLGEHTRAVLGNLLGLADTEIERLIREKVISV